MSFELASYDFDLPSELIATEPVYPRDSAKMLVYDRISDSITHSYFKDILDFVPKETCFFFNNTKVIKARLYGNKQSGGKIELLINKPFVDNSFIVYIKGRVKVSDKLYFKDNLEVNILKLNNDGSRQVEFVLNNCKLDFSALCWCDRKNRTSTNTSIYEKTKQ